MVTGAAEEGNADLGTSLCTLSNFLMLIPEIPKTVFPRAVKACEDLVHHPACAGRGFAGARAGLR